MIAYFINVPVKDFLRLIYQRYIVAKLLHRGHVMSRKDNGSSLIPKFKDFIFQQVNVYRVKSGKGFVEIKDRVYVKQLP